MVRSWRYWLVLVAICSSLMAGDVLARGGGGGGGRGGGGFGGGGGGRSFGGGGFGGGGSGGFGGGGSRDFGGGGFGGGGSRDFGGGGFGGGGSRDFGGGGFNGGGRDFGGGSGFGGAGEFAGNRNIGGMNYGGDRNFNNFGGNNFAGDRNFNNINGGEFRNFDSNLSGRSAFQSTGAYQHADANQLGNFLNMPARGGNLGDAGMKTWTTPGGSTITAGGAAGSHTFAGGTTIGGAAGGVKVDGAGGNTYTHVGSATGAKGPNGYAAVNTRGAWGVDGVAGGAHSAHAVRGPDGNTIAYGRGGAFANGQFRGGRTWADVNGHYGHWNHYTPDWYRRYPGCWYPGGWAVAGLTAWSIADWATAGAYIGCDTTPIYYDYGNNISYDNGNVYYGNEPVASSEQYYDQAQQIAADGTDATNQDWMPLGVFVVLKDDNKTPSDKTIQLALNKQGDIRGNFESGDTVEPITGSVDKKTQRVAFTIKDSPGVVIEAGLYNLTNDEVPLLVHVGADKTDQHIMMRLQKPQDDKAAGDAKSNGN